MAHVTAVTIGHTDRVSANYQSQEVSVSVTFQLERSDDDLQAFVEDKAAEVESAHGTIWRRIRELREQRKAEAEATATAAAEAAETPAEAPTATPRPTRRRKSAPDPWPQDPPPLVNGQTNGSVSDSANGQDHGQALGAANGHTNGAANGHALGEANGSANGATYGDPVGVGTMVAEPPPATQPELPTTSPLEAMATVAQQRALLTLAHRAGMEDAGLSEWLLARCGKPGLDDLTKQEAAQLLVELQRGDH